ncbi:MAG: hypothetical protein WCK17_09485, partial [Verrucomicrobiota bacterium]
MERVIPLRWVRPYVLFVLLASVTQAGFAIYYVAHALPLTVSADSLDNIGSHAPPTLYGFNAYRDVRNTARLPVVPRECYLTADPSSVENEAVFYHIPAKGLCRSGTETFFGDEIFGTNTIYSPFVATDPPARIIGSDPNGYVLVSTSKTYPERFTVHRQIPDSASLGIAVTGT